MENPFEEIQKSIQELSDKIDELNARLDSHISNRHNLEYFKTDEVMSILKISRVTLHRILTSGQLKYVKRGRTIYVSKKELERYFENK